MRQGSTALNNFRRLISVYSFNNLGQQMSNALIAKYADTLGASESVIGIVASMSIVTAFLFKIVSAPAMDAFNRKYILLAGMGIVSMAFMGYACSFSISSLIIFRLINGISQAFIPTCCLSLAADYLPEKKLGTGIGYLHLSLAVFQAIGTNLALRMVEHIGYHTTFLFSMACTVVGAFLTLTMTLVIQPEKKFSISINNILAREAIPAAFILVFLCLVNYSTNTYLIIYAEGRNIGTSIGYYYMIYVFVGLLARPAAGYLADRFGFARVLIPSILCYIAACLLISVSDSLWMFLIAAILSALGYGVSQPTLRSMSMKAVEPEKRGAASCTSYIGSDIGNFLGPILAGAVIEAYSFPVMWRMMVIPSCISLAACFFIYHKK